MSDTGGDAFLASNDDIIYWILQFRNLEGFDIFPAPACAVKALATAVQEGRVGKEDVIMLNVTGGGSLQAMGKGFHLLEPELVLSPELSADEIIAKVDELF